MPGWALLPLLLAVLCRRGVSGDPTTSANTMKLTTAPATSPLPQTSGPAKVSAASFAPSSAKPATQAPGSSQAPSAAAAKSSAPTLGPGQATTAKDGHTGASAAPSVSPTGARTKEPAVTSSVTPPTSPAPVLPRTSLATTVTSQENKPTVPAVTTTGRISTGRTSTQTSPAPKPAESPSVTGAPGLTVSASQRNTSSPQGSSPIKGFSTTTAKDTSASSSRGSSVQITPKAGSTAPSQATLATTGTTPKETTGAAVPQSPERATQPAPSSPGVQVTLEATRASPRPHSPPLAAEGNRTGFITETQILCEKMIPSENQAIVLTFNQSTPCDSLIKSSKGEPLLNVLCKTMRPNFNRSRDQCLVRLAPVADNPSAVAIVGVTMQINSVADELFESLKIKEGELEKIGLSNLTYAGQTMDLDSEDRFSMPLIITIVCMAASLLLVAAVYGCCHQRIAQRKDQQRLTEELQTMENGYHDNPTLEVMETSSEMQEKKVNLNGELGDSWIVPMDNLTKEDLEEEEDTHL